MCYIVELVWALERQNRVVHNSVNVARGSFGDNLTVLSHAASGQGHSKSSTVVKLYLPDKGYLIDLNQSQVYIIIKQNFFYSH